MLNDSELATLRNRFKRDAELLMQTSTAADEDEKTSKLHLNHHTGSTLSPAASNPWHFLTKRTVKPFPKAQLKATVV